MAVATVLIFVPLILCTLTKLLDGQLILSLIFVGSVTPVLRLVHKMQLMYVDMQILLICDIVFEFFEKKKKEQFLGKLNLEMAQ